MEIDNRPRKWETYEKIASVDVDILVERSRESSRRLRNRRLRVLAKVDRESRVDSSGSDEVFRAGSRVGTG